MPRVYSLFLGPLPAGDHRLLVWRDEQYSAPQAHLTVHSARVTPVDPHDLVVRHAPIIFLRPGSLERFSDIPLLTYAEQKGSELEYTVIFSNEDGGTSTSRLIARWGRTVDIEYVYRVLLNPDGSRRSAVIQGKNHQDLPFNGPFDGDHPLLAVATLNNMVAPATGPHTPRMQLMPVLADLSRQPREAILDSHPEIYAVMSKELIREGKIRPFGVIDGDKISDPKNYLFVDLQVENQSAAIGLRVRLQGERKWRTSWLGSPDAAIQRSGWVRTTVELPPEARNQGIAEIGFDCLALPAAKTSLPGSCRVLAMPRAFFLDANYRPGASILRALSLATTLAIGESESFLIPR